MADTLQLPAVIDLARLAEPFPADAISWRVGATNKDKTKGLALAYIDARDVMDRLDAVCGLQGWQCEYTPMPNGTTCCRIGILIGNAWVWKSNGAGATGDVSNENEREMAEKGGYSDALKRAAVVWGVGRYLYSLPATWVAIEQRGKSHVIQDSEYARLRVAAGGVPSLPPPRQQPPAKVVNPATGRMINPNSAHQQRKNGSYEAFEAKARSFTDIDELEGWWRDANTQAKIDQWPQDWQQNASDEYDRCRETLMNAGRP